MGAWRLLTWTESFSRTMLILVLVLSLLTLSESLQQSREGTLTPQQVESAKSRIIDIRMPKVRPIKDDHYICTAKSVEEFGTQFITKFEPASDADRAHHMLLYTCDNVSDELLSLGSWDCNHHRPSCSRMKIAYAWAKNAPPTILPKDVGFQIGVEANIKFLVLQVHYAHPMPEGTQDDSGFRVYATETEPAYLAGIMILMKGYLVIPPFKEKTHADMNCLLQSNTAIVPFAARVHTHKLGSVVSGYYAQSTDTEFQFHPLAKGNPQWPQAFYPLKEKVVLNPKDLIAARCTYNTTDFDQETNIGSTAGDEMCNLYIMFYTASRDPEDHYIECIDEQFEKVSSALPPDSDVPLPRNKTLEEHAVGHGHNSHPGMEPVDEGRRKSHTKKRPGISLDQFDNEEAIPEFRQQPSNADNRLDRQMVTKSVYHVNPNWPDSSLQLGQASGVDFDIYGNIVVFHRGDRSWGYETFDNWNRFLQKDLGPIASDTVYVIQPGTGKLIHQWGRDMFYMPHDITVAPNGDTFLTDVALHQVFKFRPGESSPSLTLGEAFVPGNDDTHFCKPAAVAVMKSGDFFVADGYCNSRIMKFDKTGRKLLQFGRAFQPDIFHRVGSLFGSKPPPYSFSIPHALALAEDQDMICVADRENGRIQCFSSKNGTFRFLIDLPAFGGKVFSVAYSPIEGGTLFAVNGQTFQPGAGSPKVQGFVIPLSTRRIASVFSPGGIGFGQPHDIAVNTNASQIYVVGISKPYKVWRFDRNTDAAVISGAGRTGKGDPNPAQSVPVAPSNKEVLPGSPSSQNVGASALLPKLPNEAASGLTSEDKSFKDSVIIMAFLTIPILILVAVGAILRLRARGCCSKRKESKSFSEFFPPSAGFEKLRMDESDNENSDTEVEEFALPSYRKHLKT